MPRYSFNGTDGHGDLAAWGLAAPFAVFDAAKQDWIVLTRDADRAHRLVALLNEIEKERDEAVAALIDA